MLSFLRGANPPRTSSARDNPVIYEQGRSAVEFHSPDAGFIMTHTIPPTSKENGVSIIQPPFHFHIHQDEKFFVHKGTGNFWMGVAKEPVTQLSGAPGGKRTFSIPAGRYHRFENASTTEDLVIDIQLDPEDYENEQRFFRNFFGYLDDCKKSKTEPSLFQLIVFLHSADTPLALPLPVETLGVWTSRIFMFVVASWGKFALGYKDTYAEYYEQGKDK